MRQSDEKDGLETDYLQSRVIRSVAAWHADGAGEESPRPMMTATLPTEPSPARLPDSRQDGGLSERGTVNAGASPYLVYPHRGSPSPYKACSAREAGARRSCSVATTERSPIEPETLLREVMQPREASVVPGYSRSVEPALVSSGSSYSSFTESSSSYTVSHTVERNLQSAYEMPGIVSPAMRAAQEGPPPLDIDAETEGPELAAHAEAVAPAAVAVTLTRTSTPTASDAQSAPAGTMATAGQWRRRLAIESDLVCEGRERLKALLQRSSFAATTPELVAPRDEVPSPVAPLMQPHPDATSSQDVSSDNVTMVAVDQPMAPSSPWPALAHYIDESRSGGQEPSAPALPPTTSRHAEPTAVSAATPVAATTSSPPPQSPPRFSPFRPSLSSPVATPVTTPARGVATRLAGEPGDTTACAMAYAAKLLEIHQLYKNMQALRLCPGEGVERATTSPSPQRLHAPDGVNSDGPRWDRACSGNVLLSADSLSCVADATRARRLMGHEHGMCGMDRQGMSCHVRLPLYALGTPLARGAVVHYTVHLSGVMVQESGERERDVDGLHSTLLSAGPPRYAVGLTTDHFRGQQQGQHSASHVPLFLYRSDGGIATALTRAEDRGAAYGPCFSAGARVVVRLDRARGELGFGVDGTELGVAFAVPLAAVGTLVPVVIFRDEGDGACLL